MKIIRVASLCVVLLTCLSLLYFGQTLLIPFVIALFLYSLIGQLNKYLRRIPFVGKKAPSWLLTGFSTTLVILGTIGFVQLTARNARTLKANLPLYQKNIDGLIDRTSQTLDFDLHPYVDEFTDDFDVAGTITTALDSVSVLLNSLLLIVLYIAFMYVEQRYFGLKMKRIVDRQRDLVRYRTILEEIESTLSSYIFIKTIISLGTAGISYGVFVYLGLQFPLFWSILIFVFNFIPNIGSIIATAFPAIFALIQFGNFTNSLIIVLIVGIVQVVGGNYVEPRLVGTRLNISPLVTFLALGFWGMLWGVVGMFLSVPITVIMMIVFDQFEETRYLATILSENGDFGIKESEKADEELRISLGDSADKS